MSFFSYSEFEISTSVAVTYTKPSSYIPINIMKAFTEGFVHIAWII